MKLRIKNFAKIKDADINIDGITVIAGENNTGKSTVGKILFSLFNSLSNVDEKILEERLKEIESTNRIIIQNNTSDIEISRSMVSHSALNISRRIRIKIKETLDIGETISDEKLYEIVKEDGPAHNRTFECIVKVDGHILGKGVGSSKKTAEQAAAKEALAKQAK